MSLILEALRKSEAERRRAQAPDLLAEPQLALPPATRRAPPRGALLAAGIVGLLAIAWLARGLWAPDATQAETAARRPPAVPARTVAPPQPIAAPDRTVAMPAIQAPAPASPQPLETASVPPAAAPAPAASTAGPVRVDPAAATDVPPQAATVPPPVAIPAPASAPRPVATFPPTQPTIATDAPLALADLGTDERKQLPPLKLSMHMWNDTPAQRFVILDGQRLGEGDRIGDAVVERIAADGVILAWNGRRLRLPLR